MVDLRPINPGDLDLVCRHRETMFREAGRAEALITRLHAPFCQWLGERLADGRYFGFVAEEEGEPIGAVGLMEIDWPPHPSHPDAHRRGYLLNLFVEPTHRSRGVARQLVLASEAEFRRRGLAYAVLHATEAGRPLYESLGWATTSEMGKLLDEP